MWMLWGTLWLQWGGTSFEVCAPDPLGNVRIPVHLGTPAEHNLLDARPRPWSTRFHFNATCVAHFAVLGVQIAPATPTVLTAQTLSHMQYL